MAQLPFYFIWPSVTSEQVTGYIGTWDDKVTWIFPTSVSVSAMGKGRILVFGCPHVILRTHMMPNVTNYQCAMHVNYRRMAITLHR